MKPVILASKNCNLLSQFSSHAMVYIRNPKKLSLRAQRAWQSDMKCRCEGEARGNLKSSFALLRTRLRSFHSLAMTLRHSLPKGEGGVKGVKRNVASQQCCKLFHALGSISQKGQKPVTHPPEYSESTDTGPLTTACASNPTTITRARRDPKKF